MMLRSENVGVDQLMGSESNREEVKSRSNSLNSHQHQPVYASLAEYTLQSHRSFPIESALESSSSLPHTRRRPSSPLRRIDELSGPFGNYQFPSEAPVVSPKRKVSSGNMSSTSPTNPTGGAGSSVAAQHRMSLSGRPRRPSPLLHEIQPPSRRLSAHQMLLLTPFGGPLPAGALTGAGGMGMSRGSSSMGSSASPLATAPARLGSGTDQSSGWPRRESGHSVGISSGATSMAPSPTSMGMGRELPASVARLPPRARHSLGGHSSLIGHSPLASAPMTTIESRGSSEGSSSRDPSKQSSARNETFMSREAIGVRPHPQEPAQSEDITAIDRAKPRLMPSTVAMTRSNSLPVLTLRELSALREKDGELGIQRGGDWAWVSRDATANEIADDSFEGYTPGLSSVASASISTTPLTTPFEPPSSVRHPFTAFQDPFAPRAATVSVATSSSQEAATPTTTYYPAPAYTPAATSSDYHYAPSWNEGRRMSDAPPTDSGSSPSGKSVKSRDARRPSAPVSLVKQSLGHLTPRQPSQPLPSQQPQQPQPQPHVHYQPPHQSQQSRSLNPSPRSTFQAQMEHVDETSPGGTPLMAPTRPPLTRYRSSPARYTGLGLNIVVRANASGATGRDSGSEGSQHPSEGSEPRGSVAGSVGRRGSGIPTVGHWAEVDFVDSLAAASISGQAAASNTPAARLSITSTFISTTAVNPPPAASSANGRSFGRASVVSTASAPSIAAYTIEHVASRRSHVSEFEAFNFKGRSRFESVDSALPLMPGGGGGRLSVPFSGAGEGFATHAENVALSTGSGSGVSEWGEGGPSMAGGEGAGYRRGSLGMGTFARLRNAMIPRTLEEREAFPGAPSGAHWSDRRGSWAEGWTKRV
ncbi:hypothetical protein IAR55_002990 [Kwoniella newhampshirensis]|uniref:Uncharacterized protein n=1 Tax=Kwoniella newhampshirensis TaxID=1651941 RepID=A0AAW0YPI7_9TREE